MMLLNEKELLVKTQKQRLILTDYVKKIQIQKKEEV